MKASVKPVSVSQALKQVNLFGGKLKGFVQHWSVLVSVKIEPVQKVDFKRLSTFSRSQSSEMAELELKYIILESIV